MPKAATSSNTSRRALLAAATIPCIPAPSEYACDGELLVLLGRFDALEAKLRDLSAAGAYDPAVEDELAPRIDAAAADLAAMCDSICAAPARTLSGVLARARSLAAWAPHLCQPGLGRGLDRRLQAALLRDLVALSA